MSSTFSSEFYSYFYGIFAAKHGQNTGKKPRKSRLNRSRALKLINHALPNLITITIYIVISGECGFYYFIKTPMALL